MAFLAYVLPSSNNQTDYLRAAFKRANIAVLETAISVIEILAPNLKHITIQSGGKVYGMKYLQTVNIPWNHPLKESMPRAPEPYAS